MSQQLKEMGIQHGMSQRIARKAGVSANVVSNVLNNKDGVSHSMRLKVAQAAKQVVALVRQEQAKTALLLATLAD